MGTQTTIAKQVDREYQKTKETLKKQIRRALVANNKISQRITAAFDDPTEM